MSKRKERFSYCRHCMEKFQDGTGALQAHLIECDKEYYSNVPLVLLPRKGSRKRIGAGGKTK